MISDKQHEKINELLPHAQWAARQLVLRCQQEKGDVDIIQSYRSQTEQNHLFCKGRTIKDMENLFLSKRISSWTLNLLTLILLSHPKYSLEHIVTWTLDSKHTKRLALDMNPIGLTFRDLTRFADNLKITHPIKTDLWHFEFDNARGRPISLSVDALVKRLKRGINRAFGSTKEMLERTLSRLIHRI